MEVHIPYGNLCQHRVGDWLGDEIVTDVAIAPNVWDGDDLVPGTILGTQPPHRVACVQIRSALGILWQVSRTCHKTGKVRERLFPNISETIESGETPIEAAVRGLREELGLEVSTSALTFPSSETEVKPSPTTGTVKAYVFTRFGLELEDAVASALPLSADEGDCTIAFEWR